MIETVASYNSFWLIIIGAITIISIGGILGIVVVNLKTKDNGLFNNIFNRHSDEHEDTTSKMASMHDKVIPIKYTSIQEHEMHHVQCSIRELEKKVNHLDKKVDELVERVLTLENAN